MNTDKFIVRKGGLVPTYYVASNETWTCHLSEATVYPKNKAEFAAWFLQPDYDKGVRAIKL